MKKNILIIGMAVIMTAGGMARAQSQEHHKNQKSGQIMTMGTDMQAMKQDTLQMLNMKRLKMQGTENTKMPMHSKMNKQGEMPMQQCMMMMKKMKAMERENGMSMHKSMEGKGTVSMHSGDSSMSQMKNHKSHQQMMACMTEMHQQMMKKMAEMQSKCSMKNQMGESKPAPEESLRKDSQIKKLEPKKLNDNNIKLNNELWLY